MCLFILVSFFTNGGKFVVTDGAIDIGDKTVLLKVSLLETKSPTKD